MEEKTVFMFPGQGSQYVGMRKVLGTQGRACDEYFSRADKILGIPLTGIIDEGPEAELTRTSNLQPSLLAMGAAFCEAVMVRGHVRHIVMGHSLGEYAALVAAGALKYDDALAIVRKRGELMEKAAEKTPGSMAAVIGAKREVLEQVIARCTELGVIEITNFNAPTQLVLSGTTGAVDRAIAIIGEEGAGRAIKLNVAAPFHSSLIKPVADEFAEFLARYEFTAPAVEFIDNVTGMPESDPARIREKLVLQLSMPVLWQKSVTTAYDRGGRVFIECGPGNVLSGLVKRIVTGVSIIVGEKLLAT